MIGDGAGGSGVVENITDLTGMVIPTGGTLLLAEDLDILGMATPDYIVNLNFENGDNVTHFLCMNFYGYLQQDLDTDDDGILDAEPWTGTIDGVRIVGDTSSDAVYTYVMDEEVGPTLDGYVPAHVYRYTSSCGSYMYGTYDPYDPDSVDSPGSENPPCPNPCPADLDGSGVVDVADLLELIAGWGGNDPTHDIDGDGSVGVGDLLIIIAAWGPC